MSQAVAQGNPLFGQLLQGVSLQRVSSHAPHQADLWLSMNMGGQHAPSNPPCSLVFAACLKLGQFLETSFVNGTALLVCNFTPTLASKDQLQLFFFFLFSL